MLVSGEAFETDKVFSGFDFRLCYTAIQFVFIMEVVVLCGLVTTASISFMVKRDTLKFSPLLLLFPLAIGLMIWLLHVIFGGRIFTAFFRGDFPDPETEELAKERRKKRMQKEQRGDFLSGGLKTAISFAVFPCCACLFFVAHGLHFLASVLVLLFTTFTFSVVRILGGAPRDEFFSSFRGASAVSLAYVYHICFPFLKMPGKFVNTSREIIPNHIKIVSFVFFCVLLPLVDIAVDLLYLISFYAVSVRDDSVCSDRYQDGFAEFNFWKALIVISVVLGCLVTFITLGHYIYKFYYKGRWIPFSLGLKSLSEEVVGYNFHLYKTTMWSTTAKLFGSFLEHFLQLLIACGTVGYLGEFTLIWVWHVIISAVSIAFYWGIVGTTFVYGNAFHGRQGRFLQISLTLFLAMCFVMISFLSQLSGHFSCTQRPHVIDYFESLKDLSTCSVAYNVCVSQFQTEVWDGTVHWTAINFAHSMSVYNVSSLTFANLAWVTGSLDIANEGNMTKLLFPELSSIFVDSGNNFTISNNEQLETLDLGMLVSLDMSEGAKFGITQNPHLISLGLGGLSSLRTESRHFFVDLEISNNTQLAALSFPSLMAVDGLVRICIHDNPQVQHVEFPLLDPRYRSQIFVSPGTFSLSDGKRLNSTTCP